MFFQVFQSYMTWFLFRNTPFTATFSFYVKRLLETGVMAKLYKDHVGGLIADDSKVSILFIETKKPTSMR